MSPIHIRQARTTADLHAVCDVATAAFAPRDPLWVQRAIRLACHRRHLCCTTKHFRPADPTRLPGRQPVAGSSPITLSAASLSISLSS